MRYTETSHKIENPADLIRVVSSCVILSLFRMVNEYSKRVMFLGKEKLRIQLLVALLMNVLLLLGEFIHRFVLGDEVIVVLETHFIPLLISLALIGVLLVVVNKSTSLSFEVSANPDEEMSEDFEMPNISGNARFSVFSGVSAKPEEQHENVTESFEDVPSGEFQFSDEIQFDSPAEDDLLSEDDFGGNDSVLSSILSGNDLDAISAEINNKNNSLRDVMDALSSSSIPKLDDFPDTSPEVSHEISKNIEDDKFGVLDGPEIDMIGNQEELDERFSMLFGI